MPRNLTTAAAIAAVLPLALACQSDGDDAASVAAGGSAASALAAAAATGSGTAASAHGGLVRVTLQNVAGDLATQLGIDRAAVPADAQASVELAAAVCGVSVQVLSVPTEGQAACAAKTASADLGRLVQQQLASGGSTSAGAGAASTPPATQPPATTPN
jgi:hypothetical protein